MTQITKFDNPVSVANPYTPSINLQLFAEEGGEVGNSGEIPAEAGETGQNVTDLNGQVQEFFNAAMNPTAKQEGQAKEVVNGGTEQTPEETPLILGKFKSQDDLVKAYTNLEGFSTQTRQELARVNELLENQKPVEKVVDKPEENPAEQLDEEALAVKKEEILNRFYEDPLKFIDDINKNAEARAEEIAKKMVEPIYQEREQSANQKKWDGIASQFKATHPDMTDYSEDMIKFLDDNKEIAGKENSIELAYNYAKGTKAQNQKSPDELLNDPEFIQKAISNENFRNEVLKATAAGVKKGGPPPVISGNVSGGKPVAVPPTQAKSFKEAGQMMLKSLGLSN